MVAKRKLCPAQLHYSVIRWGQKRIGEKTTRQEKWTSLQKRRIVWDVLIHHSNIGLNRACNKHKLNASSMQCTYLCKTSWQWVFCHLQWVHIRAWHVVGEIDRVDHACHVSATICSPTNTAHILAGWITTEYSDLYTVVNLGRRGGTGGNCPTFQPPIRIFYLPEYSSNCWFSLGIIQNTSV